MKLIIWWFQYIKHFFEDESENGLIVLLTKEADKTV